jgi:ATP-dependent exoDNAse (exonuclease V) alpha subunit
MMGGIVLGISYGFLIATLAAALYFLMIPVEQSGIIPQIIAPTENGTLAPLFAGLWIIVFYVCAFLSWFAASRLNRALQDALNPRKDGIVRGEKRFRVGDRVMQIRNNYDREVFNGDIGRIEAIDSADRQMVVRYENRPVTYEFGDLDEIVLAYAATVHKAQGSEFAAVVMPVVTQHYVMLQRNLIYTAATRARHLMVMVGTRKALAIAVGNDAPQQRYTRLGRRIRQAPERRLP